MQTIYMPFNLIDKNSPVSDKVNHVLLLEISPETSSKINYLKNSLEDLISTGQFKQFGFGKMEGLIALKKSTKWAIFNTENEVLHKGKIDNICYQYDLGVFSIMLPEFMDFDGFKSGAQVKGQWLDKYHEAMNCQYTSLARTDRWISQLKLEDGDLICDTPLPNINQAKESATQWLGLPDGSIAVLSIEKDDKGFKKVRSAGAPPSFNHWIDDAEKVSSLLAGDWCPDNARILAAPSCRATYYAGNNSGENFFNL